MFTALPPTSWIENDAGAAVDLGTPWVEPEHLYLSAGAITNDIDRLYCELWESHDGGDFVFLSNIPTPIEQDTVTVAFKRTRRYVQVRVFIETEEADQSAILSAIILRSS